MSQASKRRALARVRERERVARFIADHIPVNPPEGMWSRAYESVSAGRMDARDATRLRGKVPMLLAGGSFDVHSARTAARSLVALEAEQAVFEDWCRERGMGPEAVGSRIRNPRLCTPCICDMNPETTDGPDRDCPWHGDDDRPRPTGPMCSRTAWPSLGACGCEGDGLFTVLEWPGSLAREYAWKRCPNECVPAREVVSKRPAGEVQVGASITVSYTSALGRRVRVFGEDHRLCTCVDGWVRHGDRDPRAPMGRTLARLGRRVLAALEGQPSECQAPRCDGGVATIREPGFVGQPEHAWPVREAGRCPDCRGTGHNLRGVLPPVEWPAVVRRKALDSMEEFDDANPMHRRGHLYWIERGLGLSEPMRRRPTRVVPRGEHRDASGPPMGFTRLRADVDGGGYKAGERIRVRGYGRGRWLPRGSQRARRELHEVPLAPGFSGPRKRVQWDQWDLAPRWRRGELRHAEQRGNRSRARIRGRGFDWAIIDDPAFDEQRHGAPVRDGLGLREGAALLSALTGRSTDDAEDAMRHAMRALVEHPRGEDVDE